MNDAISVGSQVSAKYAQDLLTNGGAFKSFGDAASDALSKFKQQQQQVDWSFQDAQTSLNYVVEDLRSAVSALGQGKALSADEVAAISQYNNQALQAVTIAGQRVKAEEDIIKAMSEQDKEISNQSALRSIQNQIDMAMGSGSTLSAHQQMSLSIDAQTTGLQAQLKALDQLSAARDRQNKLDQAAIAIQQAAVGMANDSGFDIAARVLEAKANQADTLASVKLDDQKAGLQSQVDALSTQKTQVTNLIQLDSLRAQYNDTFAQQSRTQAEADAAARLTDLQTYASQMETVADREIDSWSTSQTRRLSVMQSAGHDSGTTFGAAFDAALAKDPGAAALLNSAIAAIPGINGQGSSSSATPRAGSSSTQVAVNNTTTINLDGQALQTFVQKQILLALQYIQGGVSLTGASGGGA